MQATQVLAPSRAADMRRRALSSTRHPSLVTRHSRVECALAYAWHREDWKRMHEKQQWRELAVSVTRASYNNDLAYFYLGEAAKGLDLLEVAKKYYARAIEAAKAEKTCAGGLINTCNGIEVVKRAQTALMASR